MSVLPQITYGNVALIFLHYLIHLSLNGYKRIAADIGLVQISATIVLVIEANILNK
jgi:hypothetical protein